MWCHADRMIIGQSPRAFSWLCWPSSSVSWPGSRSPEANNREKQRTLNQIGKDPRRSGGKTRKTEWRWFLLILPSKSEVRGHTMLWCVYFLLQQAISTISPVGLMSSNGIRPQLLSLARWRCVLVRHWRNEHEWTSFCPYHYGILSCCFRGHETDGANCGYCLLPATYTRVIMQSHYVRTCVFSTVISCSKHYEHYYVQWCTTTHSPQCLEGPCLFGPCSATTSISSVHEKHTSHTHYQPTKRLVRVNQLHASASPLPLWPIPSAMVVPFVSSNFIGSSLVNSKPQAQDSVMFWFCTAKLLYSHYSPVLKDCLLLSGHHWAHWVIHTTTLQGTRDLYVRLSYRETQSVLAKFTSASVWKSTI